MKSMAAVISVVRTRAINIIYSWDCALFSTLTLGGSYAGESFSSSAHRAKLLGKAWRFAEPVIDAVFLLLAGQANHCEWAYKRTPENTLPPEQLLQNQ